MKLHYPSINGPGAGHTGVCGADFSAVAVPTPGFINGDARDVDGGCTWDDVKVTCEPCKTKREEERKRYEASTR